MTEDNKIAPSTNDDESRRKANMVKAGIGIGIGSAAIVAALLYSNSARRKKDDTKVKREETED
ncbi:hypothetical protein [Aquisediminimonas profunda]|uniref:hypothetical protein n=1 Tax=Aquisediminimonas profunda TaxID=1550733 RepID=UPI001C62CB77|nr:hypothetical protein [Aquisediminimonas profunda]